MPDARLLPSSIADERSQAFQALIDRQATLSTGLLAIYNMDLAPAAALDSLASQLRVLGVRGWSLATTDAQKRDLLKRAISLHRKTGTPWAIKQALDAVGWPNGVLEERLDGQHFYNGAIQYDGSYPYGGGNVWAMFRVQFDLGDRGLAAADVALIRASVEAWKPVSRHLAGLKMRLALSGGIVDTSKLGLVTQVRMENLGGTTTYQKDILGLTALGGGSYLATFGLTQGEEAGSTFQKFTLLDAGGAVVATITRSAALEKTSDWQLVGEWTLNPS